MKNLLEAYRRDGSARFSVASNPQFLREGTAVSDSLHPDFVLAGVEDQDFERLLHEIYSPILERSFCCPLHPAGCPAGQLPKFLVTTVSSAELIKHATNAFLALKISYANCLADLCERVGANIDDVTRAMGLDPRIGARYLKAGLGFGGFRLPTHFRALIRLGEHVGVDLALLREVERINRERVDSFLEKARKALWVFSGKQIGLLGLAYKPETEDFRFAPSLPLIAGLTAEGASLRAYDPLAADRMRVSHPEILFVQTPYDAAQNADALMILTDSEAFADLDWRAIRENMTRPLVLDGRNVLDAARMKALGFEYHSVGRSG